VTESAIISRAPLASGKRVLESRRTPLREAVARSAIEPASATQALAEAEAQLQRGREIAAAVAAARLELEAQHREWIGSELEREREAMRAEGRREGREAALAEARAERADAAERLRSVLAAMDASHAAMLEGAEEAAVAIGFAAACRILGDTLLTPEGVRAAVQAVLAQARAGEHAVIRLHADDVERLGALAEQRAPLAAARIVADAAVEVGSCCVDTSAGTLESRLDARMADLRDALLAAHRARVEDRE